MEHCVQVFSHSQNEAESRAFLDVGLSGGRQLLEQVNDTSIRGPVLCDRREALG